MRDDLSAFRRLLLENLFALQQVRDLTDHELSLRNRLMHVPDDANKLSEADYAALVRASWQIEEACLHKGNSAYHVLTSSSVGQGRSLPTPEGLHLPPGLSLSALAQFIYSRKIYDRVFQPILADMQHEYFEALKDGQQRKAQWVMWRGRLSFVMAVFAQVPVSITRLIVKLWKAAS